MKNKILITTAIDYANDVIHIGHAYQKILADAFARFYRLSGKEVFLLTGTDEHGANIEKIAKKNNQKVEDYVKSISDADKKQIDTLNISYDRFIRTTDQDHKDMVKIFWNKIYSAGDIYLKKFEDYYCLSCESFKSGSEIINGCCDIHRSKKLTQHKEKNYFFKWSKYQGFLEKFYQDHPGFVLSEKKYNEMKNFLSKRLDDISISRQQIHWGIPVPNDPSQVIYVWFDALINYYTAGFNAGFWDNDTSIIHFLGKDNLRWHALLWPAMLKAAGLGLPDIVYAHGFINIDGQKVSKTLGNIIRPTELVEEFGADSVRYYLLKEGPLNDDVDISREKMKKVCNADLANGLGNLVQRISKICQSANFQNKNSKPLNFSNEVITKFEKFKINEAIKDIQKRITQENLYIEKEKIWQKDGEELNKDLRHCVNNIRQISYDLRPIMPKSTNEIEKRFISKVIFGAPLFPRIK